MSTTFSLCTLRCERSKCCTIWEIFKSYNVKRSLAFHACVIKFEQLIAKYGFQVFGWKNLSATLCRQVFGNFWEEEQSQELLGDYWQWSDRNRHATSLIYTPPPPPWLSLLHTLSPFLFPFLLYSHLSLWMVSSKLLVNGSSTWSILWFLNMIIQEECRAEFWSNCICFRQNFNIGRRNYALDSSSKFVQICSRRVVLRFDYGFLKPWKPRHLFLAHMMWKFCSGLPTDDIEAIKEHNRIPGAVYGGNR